MKRYSLKELQAKSLEIIYDYLANDNKIYYQDQILKEGNSVPELIFKDITQLKSDIEFRIGDYTQKMQEAKYKYVKKDYREAIEILNDALDKVTDVGIEKQKRIYNETGDVLISRTSVTVPLNKKLNAYYDDFNLEVCYYDDLSNEQSIKEFNQLKTKEERIEFVKSHIEITNVAMVLNNTSSTGIALIGEFKDEYTDETSQSCELLNSSFADFNKVTLAKCESILNNDLQQIIQERIDMDRENLTLLAERNIRGDEYKIYKSKNDLYIRYVCPSTQRVYYNALNTTYLAESKYFVKNDYDSYLLAWYSINNLFMELDEEALALVTPRC